MSHKSAALMVAALCVFLGGCPGDNEPGASAPGPPPIASSPDTWAQTEADYQAYVAAFVPAYCDPHPPTRDPANLKCKWQVTCDANICAHGCDATNSFDNAARLKCNDGCYDLHYTKLYNGCDTPKPRHYRLLDYGPYPQPAPSPAPAPAPPAPDGAL